MRYRDTLSAITKTQYAEIEEIPTEEGAGAEKSNSAQLLLTEKSEAVSDKKIPIHLTKDKVAYFAYPANITESDIKLIKHQVEGILLRIQLENEENNKGAQEGSQ